jgi:hypothetical protein
LETDEVFGCWFFSARCTGVSFKKGERIYEKYYWAQVQIARDPELMMLHQYSLQVLKELGKECLVLSGELYDPHITLACIHLQRALALWPQEIVSNDKSPFKLILGEGDENGQLLKIFDEI